MLSIKFVLATENIVFVRFMHYVRVHTRKSIFLCVSAGVEASNRLLVLPGLGTPEVTKTLLQKYSISLYFSYKHFGCTYSYSANTQPIIHLETKLFSL